ncbi:TetR/AcrR family transcriptional regulator [Marinactinospora thermotolerans]|uniref:Transcriptional regulator, TetR family n=1 Tax=Marinactinospora thermotolerans DSM 45154 TaxID=1122192 RepID=A0A1T4N7D5_9ACTN|nr:TetR family transcriptional regulator [Marinactinospora thermotolerans]SJZ75210.1 transcriptional regulator, TetR family [Marinactinospora thermotolerans DSM 45154]
MNRAEAAEACADRARVRDREATRQRILDSARELFTSSGYAQVSSRMIAAHAGVNVALINRYFGAKRGLLAEVIASEAVFPGIFEGDVQTLPRRLAEYMVRRFNEEGTPLQRALEHSGSDPDLQTVYQERLRNAIIDPLADYIGGPDARVRASLVASLLVGVTVLRRSGGAASLAGQDPTAMVRRLEHCIAACLDTEVG